MDTARRYASDIAFTSSVKAVQTRKGSRPSYERMEKLGSWQRSRPMTRFIEAQTSVFLATAKDRGRRGQLRGRGAKVRPGDIGRQPFDRESRKFAATSTTQRRRHPNPVRSANKSTKSATSGHNGGRRSV
jgi:hypothetical protein